MDPIDWKTIQQQFIPSPFNTLCFGSPNFQQHWIKPQTRERIKILAELFLQIHPNEPTKPQYTQVRVGIAYLFNFEKEVKEIRIKFLQWCIDNNKQ